MAKETTTTFTVTVKHNGNKRDFWECFKRYGQINSVVAALVDTNTVKVPVKSQYSDEHKMIRVLLKRACIDAGLLFSNGKNKCKTSELYSILYSGTTNFRVELCKATIRFDFSKGFGVPGKAYIEERGVSYKNWFNSIGADQEFCSISLADPNISEDLKELFVKWGRK